MGDEVRWGESGVVEDTGGGVAHVEENLVQGAVRKIAIDQFAELLGVSEGGERAVNQADDLAEMDVGGGAAKLVSALCATNAFHHAGVLEFEEDEFEELFREDFLVGNVADLDGALVMMAGEHHHGLEGVESLWGDFHRRIIP